MNIKNISAIVSSLVLLSVAGAALAEAPYPDDVKFISTKTRAQVIAELQQARERGEIPLNEYTGAASVMPVVSTSTKTRAQVVQELKEYQQAHANPGIAEMVFLR